MVAEPARYPSGRAFAPCHGDSGSIPGRVKPQISNFYTILELDFFEKTLQIMSLKNLNCLVIHCIYLSIFCTCVIKRGTTSVKRQEYIHFVSQNSSQKFTGMIPKVGIPRDILSAVHTKFQTKTRRFR